MDIDELEQLVRMVQDSNVGELTLRNGDARVTIRRASVREAPTVAMVRADNEYDYNSQYADVIDVDDEAAAERDRTVLITAPLVGVFAHVKPLVGLNAHVTEGQVVGVIEAMKIVTEIKAPADGTVIELFIEPGHPVEFGQPLFEIRVD